MSGENRIEAMIQERLAAIMRANDDKVTIPKIYYDMVEDHAAAAVLDEIMFWTLPKTSTGKTSLRVRKEGKLWLAVKRSDWWDRKRLSERQADRGIEKLLEMELIEKDIWNFNGKPTIHLRLKTEKFVEKYSAVIIELINDGEENAGIQDISDLYAMMGFPNSPFRNLPNGDGTSLNGEGPSPNGEFINNLHAASTKSTVAETRKTDETPGYYSTAYRRGEQEKPDGLDGFLAMSQSPAVKRDMAIDDLLSKWAVAFVVKTTSKDWRKFAEYAVDQQRKDGWDPDKFIEWVKRQDGYPTYWTQKRMEENYPKAFIQDEPSVDWHDRSHPL